MRTAWVILLAAALAYGKLAHRHDVGFFEDDAVYVLSARSLLTGHYNDPTRLREPPEIHFLPGFPLLLAPLTLLAHDHDWNRLKIAPLVLALLCGLLAWILYRRWLPEKFACAALALFVFNPFTIFFSDILLSEWLLLCLTLSAILLIRNLDDDRAGIMGRSTLLVVLAWAALSRPEGILLSAGLAGALLFQRAPWRPFAWTLIPAFLVFFGWLSRNFLVSGQVSTYAHIWEAPGFSHAAQTLVAVPRMILTLEPSNIKKSLLLMLGGFIFLVGLFKERDENTPLWRTVVLFYFLLYMALRLAWPVFDDRFFLPVLPFICAYMVQGCVLFKRVRMHVAGLFLLGAAFMNLACQDILQAAAWRQSAIDPLPRHTLAFIQAQVPPRATLLSNSGGILRLYADHYSSGSVEATTPDEFAYMLLKTGTSYVWVMRQPIADRHVLRQWVQADQWMRGWPRAFPVIFQYPAETSTVYAVGVAPSFIAAYESYLDGRRALEPRDTVNALKKLDAALGLYPDFPAALNDRAVLLLDRGKLKDAEADLNAALRLRPDFALARINLARVRHLLKRRTF